MTLKWFGHSCFSLTFASGFTLVTDPFDETVGYPLCTARADAVLVSHNHFDHNYVKSLAGTPVLLNTPGPHTLGEISVTGIETFHDDHGGAKRGNNLLFRVEGDGLRIAHMGDLGHPLSDKQLAQLGPIDVMLLPIGGMFTIDTDQAIDLIEAVQPRLCIPMHYKTPYIDFPIADESEFARRTDAACLGNCIELSPEALSAAPHTAIMHLK